MNSPSDSAKEGECLDFPRPYSVQQADARIARPMSVHELQAQLVAALGSDLRVVRGFRLDGRYGAGR